jgi:competence CoiA-like predicted nuclease
MKTREIENSAHNFKMKEIFNFNTGKIEQSDFWLSQSAEVIHRLRYNLRDDRKAYGCPICKTPVILKFSRKEKPFFAHLKRAENVNCLLCDESLSNDEKRIQEYNYNKESPEHKRLKKLVAKILKKTNGVNPTTVKVEKNKKNKAISNKWKRPDIQCDFKDFELVFEIQLSKTWLSDIVERDKFYRKIKTFIFWVFSSFEIERPNQDITQADIFYNNPEINLFLFDDEAEELSKEKEELNLKCLYQIPIINLDESRIEYRWRKKMITLDDLKFDSEEFKPYFFPFIEKRIEVKNQFQNYLKDKHFEMDDSILMKIKITDYKDEIVTANISKWNDRFWILVLFQGKVSKNKSNLIKRINQFRRLGLNINETLIDKLEEKGFIEKLEFGSQIHYQLKK